jgi:hypothetical protein
MGVLQRVQGPTWSRFDFGHVAKREKESTIISVHLLDGALLTTKPT